MTWLLKEQTLAAFRKASYINWGQPVTPEPVTLHVAGYAPNCIGHNPGELPIHPAFAVYVCHGGNRVPLCKRIFDIWLDNADYEHDLEPEEVQFLSQETAA